MTLQFNQPVNTPDGPGIYIAPLNDGTEAQVAMKIPAAEFGDDDLARLCPRYATMNAQEKKQYRQKAKIPVNRPYPVSVLKELNQ